MNIYLLFNSDVVNFVLKADGDEEVGMGNEMQKVLIFYLYIYIFFFLGGEEEGGRGALIIGG